MEALGLAALGALASKVIELLKLLRAKDVNGAVTLVSIWVAGLVAVFLGAEADVTENLSLPGTGIPLGSLDTGSKILLGLVMMSSISFAYDFKKAFDQSDSAKQPPLLGPDGP